jgi:hypothetical protein
MQVQIVE